MTPKSQTMKTAAEAMTTATTKAGKTNTAMSDAATNNAVTTNYVIKGARPLGGERPTCS